MSKADRRYLELLADDDQDFLVDKAMKKRKRVLRKKRRKKKRGDKELGYDDPGTLAGEKMVPGY